MPEDVFFHFRVCDYCFVFEIEQMSSGYASEVSCRDLLLRTVGWEKQYEYLYRGLPKLEKPKTGKR
jgi:hypothetical protein